MSVTVAEFWDLLADSRLVEPDALQRLKHDFATLRGADTSGSASVLAEWLVSEGALARYHSDVLRGGRSGPFLFCDYRLTGRQRGGRLAGLFEAEHVPTGHRVLLSFLTGPAVQDKQRWKAVAQQAEIARRMVHPNLSRVYELLDLVTYKLVVVETLQGGTLGELLEGGRGLPPQEACRIAGWIASTLDSLHQQGQVYGELRPENIWLNPDGQVKLLQPPLARDLDRRPGELPRTPGSEEKQRAIAPYLAPELAQPSAVATTQSDLYALGCLLHEMFAGQPPFAGSSATEILQRHAAQPAPPLDPQRVAPPLAQVVTYLLAKDPRMRYQKASLVADTLAAHVDPAVLQPVTETRDAKQNAFENEVARRQIELRSVQRHFDALPDVDARFGRAAASSAVASSATGGGSAAALIRTGDGDAPRVRGKDKSKDPLRWAGYAGLGVAALVALVLLLGRSGSEPPEEVVNVAPAGSTAAPVAEDDLNILGPANPVVEPMVDAAEIKPVARVREAMMADDGRALWASPTRGAALPLGYLPPGPQIFLAVRPASLLAHPEGEKVFAALGPRGQQYLSDLQRITGLAADEIEQVVIGLHPGGIGEFETSMVVYLAQPTDAAGLPARWTGARSATHAGQEYFVAGSYAYYVPAQEEGRVFAVTSPKYVRDVIALGASAPPLEREMERMLADTDATRHFTLLFPPKHIFGEAHQAVFTGATADLKGPLGEFLGDEKIEAAQLSMHLDDNFFTELRIFGTLDLPPSQLTGQMQERLSGLPRQVRALIFGMQSYPYSQAILAEFPEWIRLFAEYTRSDVEHEQAVLRSYLPAVAAHNLLMGVELALAQRGGGSGGGGAVVAATSKQDASIEQILQRPMSLSFPRDTLEQSIRMVSEEIGVEIVILGSDLQLDGITKNQSFGIDLRDQPAKKILQQILLLANPDKTASGPDDPKQKLVYVIKPDESGKEAIFVTTRAQAAKRGDTLPAEFVAK